MERIKLAKGHWFLFVLYMTGYGLLLFTDWKIALGVFLIHWYVNIDIE